MRFCPSFNNPIVPNAPFLYPLKGVGKGCIGKKWVKPFLANMPILHQFSIETLEKRLKYVQSKQLKYQKDAILL